MGVCNCSMFCCTLFCVRSSNAIMLMGKRELVALLNLSSWCLVMVERLFLAVPQGCLRFVIVVFPDHTHLLFLCLVQRLLELKKSKPLKWDLSIFRFNYNCFQLVMSNDNLQMLVPKWLTLFEISTSKL